MNDRELTKIPSTQPGFINFFVKPLFDICANILPIIKDKDGCISNLKANKIKWESYEETESDHKVYKPKAKNQLEEQVKGLFVHQK